MAEVTFSAAGMRILKLLVGKPSRTVDDLIEEASVTRTAVFEQLNELVEAGFVERKAECLPDRGRGRPRNRYTATDAALLLLFASRERLLGSAIWKALGEIGGEELTHQILKHVSSTLAEHYCKNIHSSDPEERLREMNGLLAEEGELVEIDETDGQITMYKRSCSFIGMFDENRNVCRMDEMIMSHVVGKPVKRISCRLDGDPCCVFKIASPGE